MYQFYKSILYFTIILTVNKDFNKWKVLVWIVSILWSHITFHNCPNSERNFNKGKVLDLHFPELQPHRRPMGYFSEWGQGVTLYEYLRNLIFHTGDTSLAISKDRTNPYEVPLNSLQLCNKMGDQHYCKDALIERKSNPQYTWLGSLFWGLSQGIQDHCKMELSDEIEAIVNLTPFEFILYTTRQRILIKCSNVQTEISNTITPSVQNMVRFKLPENRNCLVQTIYHQFEVSLKSKKI